PSRPPDWSSAVCPSAPPALQLVLTLSGSAAAPAPPSGGRPPAGDAAAATPQAATARPAPAKEKPGPAPAVSGNGAATKREKDVIPAGPATRRLARELGVALAEVKGTGRGGRVTLDDIKGFVRTEREQVKTGGPA